MIHPKIFDQAIIAGAHEAAAALAELEGNDNCDEPCSDHCSTGGCRLADERALWRRRLEHMCDEMDRRGILDNRLSID